MDKLFKNLDELVELLIKVKTNIGFNLPTAQPIKPIINSLKPKIQSQPTNTNPEKVTSAPKSKKDPVKQAQQIDKDIDLRADAITQAKHVKESLSVGKNGQWHLKKEE